MARGKSTKLKPFQKLLTIMADGNVVTVEEINVTLGKEIYMYRLSTYIWHIKTNANGVVRALKDGRKVTGYQIVNVKEVKEYMHRVGITKSGFTPGSVEKKPSIAKLSDLKAKPAKPAKAPKKEKTVAVTPVDEGMTIVEVTETTSE